MIHNCYFDAPDFVGGGQILYDEAQMREVYENGRGSIKVRARYNVVPGENMLEITQIPPTTTVEAIMDKIAELVKAGKIKEISDMRDETDLNGLKLTLDLKRGVDPEKLMAKLYKTTPLEDSFSCNFNVLVSGQPRVMGVREILQELSLIHIFIHGDYSRWANPEMLHSVTNYELHKGLWSGHNDHNYFEIAHTMRRLQGLCHDTRLYTFSDNHDVERLSLIHI